MKTPNPVSPQTRNNWLVDASLLISGLIAALSGIYFLAFPISGYRGGRNPFYDLVLLFTRHTWEDLHTWSGIAMLVVVAVHIPLHWKWIVNMTRRMFQEWTGKSGMMNANGRFNLYLNILVGLSFLISAASGLYFFFVPEVRGASDTVAFLFTRTTWDLLHTWSSVIWTGAAVLHFAIHWKWVTKVTTNLVKVIASRLQPNQAGAAQTTSL
jgi:hypothetical protein